MKAMKLALIATFSLGISSANASDRLTDVQYIAMGRCTGIAAGLEQDVDAWRAAFDDATRGRSMMARERATEQYDNARRDVRRTDEVERSEFADELEQRCAIYSPSNSE